MANGGIYKIWYANDPSKFYIGRTSNYEQRMGAHLSLLNNGKHHSKQLQDDYNSNSIRYELIHPLKNVKDQIEVEQWYINNNCYYNQSSNAKGGRKASEWIKNYKNLNTITDRANHIINGVKNNDRSAIREYMKKMYGNPTKKMNFNKLKISKTYIINNI